MPRWSLLSGSPRVREAPAAAGELPSGSAAEAMGAARRTTWAAALVVAWALGGFFAFLLEGRLSGNEVALFGILPGAALALAAFAATRRMTGAASGVATVAVALAVAGHVLHPRNVSQRGLVLPDLVPAEPVVGLTLLFLVLLVVPALAGARIHALGLALDAGCRFARGARTTLEAFVREDARDLVHPPLWSDFAGGFARRWLEGVRLPGALALDLGFTFLDVALARVRGVTRDRLHVDAPLEDLREALGADGEGARLHVALPDRGPVEVRVRSLELPRVEAAQVLDVSGEARDVRALRELLEDRLAHVGLWCWSLPGRRLERRLNALHAEALRATTTEERGAILEEAERLAAVVGSRGLGEEDRTMLERKAERVRGFVATQMLSEPTGHRAEGRYVAPGPALAPELCHVLDAGGLGAMKRLSFVPYWILPVRTPWGEAEVAVNALTRELDVRESRHLVETLQEEAPRLLMDVGRGAAFVTAPPPTATLLREARAKLPPGVDLAAESATHEHPVEVVFVPFLPGEEGRSVNARSGAQARDPGAPRPLAPEA